jgi:hypothetical protein
MPLALQHNGGGHLYTSNFVLFQAGKPGTLSIDHTISLEQVNHNYQ